MSTDPVRIVWRLMPSPPAGAELDAAARTVAMSLSSELPVERDGYREVLEHTPDAVILDRAAAGLPLLVAHDASRGVGVVTEVRLDGRRLVGVARFGRGAEATEAWANVEAGTAPWVSIGYEIVETREEPGRVVRVTRWRPVEVSLVNLAADHTVGVGRAFKPELAMTGTNTPAPAAAQTAAVTAPHSATRAAPDRAAAEHARASDIARIAAAHAANVPDAPQLAEAAIREGVSVMEFRGRLLDAMGVADAGGYRANAGTIPGAAQDWGGHRDAARVRGFSLSNVVAAVVSGDWSKAGLEREVSRELATQAGRDARGFFVPLASFAKRAAVDTTSGAALIGTDTAANDFVDALRPESVVLAMGATAIGPLRGNVSIPRLAAGSAAVWVGENAGPAPGAPDFDNIALEPHTLAATVSYTRKAALSTFVGLEALLRRDLSEQLGRGLDKAALGGNADANAPAGILDTARTLIGRTTTNGAALSWADAAAHVTKIEAANAARGALGWVMRPELKASLMSAPKVAGSAEMIVGADNRCAGYPVAATNLLRGAFTKGTGTELHAVIFGNWADLIVASWSGVDMVVDPYSFSPKGEVRISAFLDVDFGLRHPESFCISRDVIGQPLTLTGFVPA